MTARIALLRGINVGRNKRIAMADLRAMLKSLGYQDVRTHLQSGNAIFVAGKGKDATLEQEISAAIKATFGMDVAVLVRTAPELASVVDSNPFVAQGADSSELHATFVAAAPPAAKVAAVDREACAPDEFALGDRVIYLRLRNGVMGSRLPDFDKVLGIRTTTRNWNTTTRLREMMQ
ncbi:MAG TPA: DUF1697 domain-containing protein [Candidatus Dormibacteraeota bacterium]